MKLNHPDWKAQELRPSSWNRYEEKKKKKQQQQQLSKATKKEVYMKWKNVYLKIWLFMVVWMYIFPFYHYS